MISALSGEIEFNDNLNTQLCFSSGLCLFRACRFLRDCRVWYGCGFFGGWFAWGFCFRCGLWVLVRVVAFVSGLVCVVVGLRLLWLELWVFVGSLVLLSVFGLASWWVGGFMVNGFGEFPLLLGCCSRWHVPAAGVGCLSVWIIFGFCGVGLMGVTSWFGVLFGLVGCALVDPFVSVLADSFGLARRGLPVYRLQFGFSLPISSGVFLARRALNPVKLAKFLNNF